MASDQQEFISGKKNGKLNKIIKTNGVSIRFSKINDYISAVIVSGQDFAKAFKGINMLHEELPAELSFHVPEIHHRRIIGVAGKNIQRVMKKYGVYVKFSGAEEYAALGGYYDNQDNVIARTPMKNQENLENLKLAVTSLVGLQDYVSETINVPFSQHRLVSSHVRDMCGNKVNVWWPERGETEVTIQGPKSNVIDLSALIQKQITSKTKITIRVCSQEMQQTVLRCIDELKPDIVAKFPSVMLEQVAFQRRDECKGFEWAFDQDISEVAVIQVVTVEQGQQCVENVKNMVKTHLEEYGFTYEEIEEDQFDPPGTYTSIMTVLFINIEIRI